MPVPSACVLGAPGPPAALWSPSKHQGLLPAFSLEVIKRQFVWYLLLVTYTIQHLLVRGVETNPEIPGKPVGCTVNVWSVERLSEGSQVLSPQGHSYEAEASGGGRRPAGRLKDRRVPACIRSFILRALTSACVWQAPVGVAKDGGAGTSPWGWGILGSQDAPTSDHWVLSWGPERPCWSFLRV